MNALNISDMAAFKQALQGVMQEKGATVAVAGLMGKPALRTQYTERGIRIELQMLDEYAYRPGDAFDVEVGENKITLVKSQSSA
jgi:hypothetical protein